MPRPPHPKVQIHRISPKIQPSERDPHAQPIPRKRYRMLERSQIHSHRNLVPGNCGRPVTRTLTAGNFLSFLGRVTDICFDFAAVVADLCASDVEGVAIHEEEGDFCDGVRSDRERGGDVGIVVAFGFPELCLSQTRHVL